MYVDPHHTGDTREAEQGRCSFQRGPPQKGVAQASRRIHGSRDAEATGQVCPRCTAGTVAVGAADLAPDAPELRALLLRLGLVHVPAVRTLPREARITHFVRACSPLRCYQEPGA